jgi:LemA protein
MSVQEELTSTENKIAFSRQAYNDSVMRYNTSREVFPANVVAGMFNFQEAALFEIED